LSSSIMKKGGILLLRCSSTGHSKLVLVIVLTECVDLHRWNLQVDSIAHLMAYTWTQQWPFSGTLFSHFELQFWGRCKIETYVISLLEEILFIQVSNLGRLI
jgi:hypothetical protein